MSQESAEALIQETSNSINASAMTVIVKRPRPKYRTTRGENKYCGVITMQ